MSEADEMDDNLVAEEIAEIERQPTFASFAEKVWTTFQLIDITEHVQQKGKLDYLSWANAWRYVMQTFPESTFEFDEPKMFDNMTGEQWVTVTIREGDHKLTRRWWLPYLNYKNAPVENPNAMQINNTRMRVLVKCLAMLGLGTELYAGEDVPDAQNDQKTVRGSGSVVAAVLEDVEVDWAKVSEHVNLIMAGFLKEDDDELRRCMDTLSGDNDLKVAVWSKLDSKVRAHIKKVANQ